MSRGREDSDLVDPSSGSDFCSSLWSVLCLLGSQTSFPHDYKILCRNFRDDIQSHIICRHKEELTFFISKSKTLSPGTPWQHFPHAHGHTPIANLFTHKRKWGQHNWLWPWGWQEGRIFLRTRFFYWKKEENCMWKWSSDNF